MLQDDVEILRSQLTVARNEINKLRKQVQTLTHLQRKDIDEVTKVLRDFRCEGCRLTAEENCRNSNEPITPTQLLETSSPEVNRDAAAGIRFRPIGIIRTSFPEKRAVPRQSSVGNRLRGVVELNAEFFTNPEHALEGLQDYSHLWLIYHFHKNSSHSKAKVSPPRLGGERVGVFATRSPHRPCPIGLSLVEIDKIEGATITFFGTDMINGTPVLDIKPYIPFYDVPLTSDSGRMSVGPLETADFYDSRQEPDGEESELEIVGAVAVSTANGSNGHGDDNDSTEDQQQQSHLPKFSNHISPPPNAVKVPNWVSANHRLAVLFNERAESQLNELQVHRQSIVDILAADPRSVYLRTKYGSQIFTFQLSEVTVTCKFDDKANKVTVVQIRRTENVQDDEITD